MVADNSANVSMKKDTIQRKWNISTGNLYADVVKTYALNVFSSSIMYYYLSEVTSGIRLLFVDGMTSALYIELRAEARTARVIGHVGY